MGGEDKLFYEKRARDRGYNLVAGVDEAGRGPLAGPVVAACCAFRKDLRIEGIDDSKKLTAKKRQEAYRLLAKHPQVLYSIGIVEPDEIDRINIYQATIKAMTMAIDGMPEKPDYVIVDGMNLLHPEAATEKLVKGDARSLTVGAASILAKVTRDEIMERYHDKWPCYGFNRNRGYGTVEHLKALEENGPCEIHRASFQPVKSLIEELSIC
jgi:ribonuclease HII